uniref:Uncharacterized protein n=1 Tax=Solanum lycopersicum TaxID=4081 RepID=A0A3Q7F2I0_SOLLC
MEVPESMLYSTTRLSISSFVGDDPPLHAANIFSPGAFRLTMNFLPFPSTIGDKNFLSTLLAPTVIIQGAVLDNVEGAGPEFPALQDTTIFFFMA